VENPEGSHRERNQHGSFKKLEDRDHPQKSVMGRFHERSNKMRPPETRAITTYKTSAFPAPDSHGLPRIRQQKSVRVRENPWPILLKIS
jgi:hypothetical protein